MHPLLRRSVPVAALVAAFGTSLVAGPAAAAPRPDNACISNLDGSNLNARYGVTERIVGPPTCRDALAGDKWVRAVPPWTAASENEINLFKQNFVSARWVTDEGTPREITVTAGPESLREGILNVAPNLHFIAPVSPAVRPLSIGQHTSVMYINMRAQTCNGLGLCLDAGEHLYKAATSPTMGNIVPAITFTFAPPSKKQ